MRKVLLTTIWLTAFSMGLPFALTGRWWGLLVCILVAALWLWPSKYGIGRRPTISFFILAGVGGLGSLLDYSPIWQLTNFLMLLIAWDLDNYQRTHQNFVDDPAQKDQVAALFSAHLKRLGFVTGLGWCLGMLALNIRVQINFALALLLTFLIILGLREFVRYLAQIRLSQEAD